MPQPPAEVTLSVEEVDRLLASQHPSLRGELRPVAHGWDNDVFRLGDTLAVRLPRRAAAARLIEHEQRWLPTLAAMLPVRVPVPVAVGVPDDSFPWSWSVVPWFEGTGALDLPPAARDAVAASLADTLRALHRPAPPDAPANPVRGVPLRERDEVVRERLVGDPELAEIWREAVAAPTWEGPALWVHGDVHPGNLVVGEGQLRALIDFGDLCAGDPACDLAIAWTGFTAGGREVFAAHLGADYDAATWTRARGWAVSIATAVRDSDHPGLRAMLDHTRRQLLS